MNHTETAKGQLMDELRGLHARVADLERELARRSEMEETMRQDHHAELAKTEAALRTELADRLEVEKQRRNHQQELAHVQRIATLGEMAAGLAHEINQPLSAIANYAQGCILRLDSGNGQTAELRRIMKEVVNQAQRAAEIVRRVRSFARKDWVHPSVTDINEVVRETVAFIQAEAKNTGILIHQKLAGDLSEIRADPIQIEQVLLNLIRNSFDAMRASRSGPREVTVETSANSNEVEIIVTDTGVGFPKKEAHRVFDAFYTTKPHGLGMGLSISRSIIEAHGGRITAAPHSKQGTIIRLVLPAKTADDED